MNEVVRATDGTTPVAGDDLTDVQGRRWVYVGPGLLPKEHGSNGGAFPGRVIVTDLNGTEAELYPFEVGLMFKVPWLT